MGWKGKGKQTDTAHQVATVISRQVLVTDLYKRPECLLEQSRDEQIRCHSSRAVGWVGEWLVGMQWVLTSAGMCMRSTAATGA